MFGFHRNVGGPSEALHLRAARHVYKCHGHRHGKSTQKSELQQKPVEESCIKGVTSSKRQHLRHLVKHSESLLC